MALFRRPSPQIRSASLTLAKDDARFRLLVLGGFFAFGFAVVGIRERSWWWLVGAVAAALVTLALRRVLRRWRLPPPGRPR